MTIQLNRFTARVDPQRRSNAPIDLLYGLSAQLSDTCQCGLHDAVIGEGKGPHRAAFFCSQCERHRGWMANEAHAFVTALIRKFGKPPRPIRIRRQKTKESKVNSTPKLNQSNLNSSREINMRTTNTQTDGFSVAEKSGSNLIIGKMVKFTIDGKYRVDKADILPDNTRMVAIDVTTAWVRWDEEKPSEHRTTQPGQIHPERADLPDQNEAAWQRGLNGDPTDPWRDTRYLRLIDPRTGQDYTFVTDTFGGRKAVGELKSQISNVRFAYAGAVPLVQLGGTMMKTAFGLKPRPEFKVVGWRNKNTAAVQLTDGTQHKVAEESPSEIEPPFNDQIPSFDEELIPWE
jgi:hypothetical protein